MIVVMAFRDRVCNATAAVVVSMIWWLWCVVWVSGVLAWENTVRAQMVPPGW
jgi:hypothetical protein